MLSRNKTVGPTSSSPTADILRQVRQLSAAVDTLRQVPCFLFFSAQQVASRCQDWSLQSILSIPGSKLTGHCSSWQPQNLTQIAKLLKLPRLPVSAGLHHERIWRAQDMWQMLRKRIRNSSGSDEGREGEVDPRKLFDLQKQNSANRRFQRKIMQTCWIYNKIQKCPWFLCRLPRTPLETIGPSAIQDCLPFWTT